MSWNNRPSIHGFSGHSLDIEPLYTRCIRGYRQRPSTYGPSRRVARYDIRVRTCIVHHANIVDDNSCTMLEHTALAESIPVGCWMRLPSRLGRAQATSRRSRLLSFRTTYGGMHVARRRVCARTGVLCFSGHRCATVPLAGESCQLLPFSYIVSLLLTSVSSYAVRCMFYT